MDDATNLRAACERLLLDFDEDNPSPLLQPEEDDRIRVDVLALVDACLAEHPADDGEPVTADWLDELAVRFNTRGDGGIIRVWNILVPHMGRNIAIPATAVPTRAAVRRLLAALGLTP